MSMRLFSATSVAIAGLMGLSLATPAWADNHLAPEMEMEETDTIAQEELVPTASIPEIVAGVDDFSTLEAALTAVDLIEPLMGEGPFTVFAPPNEAFEALPDGVVEALLLPENQDLLTDILTYHVVPGEVLSSDLATGDLETLEGSDLPVVIDDDMVTVGGANVVAIDVPATNGVIHVIDSVLVPEEVAAELATRLAEAEEEMMVEEEEMMVEEEVMVEEEEVMVEEEVMEETTAPAEPVRGLW